MSNIITIYAEKDTHFKIPSYADRKTNIIITEITEKEDELNKISVIMCDNKCETNRIMKDLLDMGLKVVKVSGNIIDNTYIETIFVERKRINEEL